MFNTVYVVIQIKVSYWETFPDMLPEEVSLNDLMETGIIGLA